VAGVTFCHQMGDSNMTGIVQNNYLILYLVLAALVFGFLANR